MSFLVSKGHPTAAPPVVVLVGKNTKRAALGDKVLSSAVMRPTAEAAKVEQVVEMGKRMVMEAAVAEEVAQAVASELLDLQVLELSRFSWMRWIRIFVATFSLQFLSGGTANSAVQP